MIQEYFTFCEFIIQQSPLVISYTTHIVMGSPSKGHIQGIITFADGSELTFFELLSHDQDVVRHVKYRFHYQRGNQFIFRYDNAPHHQELSTFPSHKHTSKGVEPAASVTFQNVFQEIVDMIIASD
ncbi:MAG: DUF6516 family protein [Candidatus Methanofastidiosia archaeon]